MTTTTATMIPSDRHFKSEARGLSLHIMHCTGCDRDMTGTRTNHRHNRMIPIGTPLPADAVIVSASTIGTWIECFQGNARCC